MLDSGKQVFMYFSDKPLPLSEHKPEEYDRIRAFKAKYKDKGIYYTYKTNTEFEELFFSHLCLYFLGEIRAEQAKLKRCPSLSIMGIDVNSNLSKMAQMQKFVPQVRYTKEQYKEKCISLINKAASLHVGKPAEFKRVDSSLGFSFEKPVVIEESVIKLITKVSELLEIQLPDDFFDLGNLHTSIIPTGPFGSDSVNGTQSEKDKYQHIMDLEKTISDMIAWAPIENAFGKLQCIRLALQNSGTVIDEDIEISLTIPQNSLLWIDEFPKLSLDGINYMLNDCHMAEVFGISSTAEYHSYTSTDSNSSNLQQHILPGLSDLIQDYEEDYYSELHDVFCYSIYPVEENYVLKLKINYLKHNITIAFPTILFLKKAPSEISYTITSKNSPDIVRSTIVVHE